MPCQCRTAVIRAYRELRERGQPETTSYSASVRIYRHYHPDADKLEAFETVAEWIDQLEAEGPASAGSD